MEMKMGHCGKIPNDLPKVLWKFCGFSKRFCTKPLLQNIPAREARRENFEKVKFLQKPSAREARRENFLGRCMVILRNFQIFSAAGPEIFGGTARGLNFERSIEVGEGATYIHPPSQSSFPGTYIHPAAGGPHHHLWPTRNLQKHRKPRNPVKNDVSPRVF